MSCRRCLSTRLLRLDKKCPQDNDVFRCQDCGFLFSPSISTEDASSENALGDASPDGETSRTVAVHSGYRGRK